MRSASKPKNQAIHTNTVEALRETSYVEQTTAVVKNEANAAIDTLWNQLLGVKEQPASHPTSGEMQAGQSIDFTATKKHHDHQPQPAEQPKRMDIAAGINYRSEILQGERRISKETEQMLTRQIQEISNELRQLVNSSKELAAEFKDVAVEQRVTKPGKYHVSLFQFILTIVKQARMKVESSSACLSIAKGKKKKQGYWDLFAQQGTSFSMNNERAIATQAG